MERPIEEVDWTVDGRRGLKLLAGGEYAVGQVLSNGYTITWTTDDSAIEAVERCVVTNQPGTTATVRYERNERADLADRDIIPFLKQHACWWVKLRRPDFDDYVVYVAGSEETPSELASLGAPLKSDQEPTKRRVEHVRMMMERTATPVLRDNLGSVFRQLVETVSVGC